MCNPFGQYRLNLPAGWTVRPRSRVCLLSVDHRVAPARRRLALSHRWGRSRWARWLRTRRRTWPQWRSWGSRALVECESAGRTASCCSGTWTFCTNVHMLQKSGWGVCVLHWPLCSFVVDPNAKVAKLTLILLTWRIGWAHNNARK